MIGESRRPPAEARTAPSPQSQSARVQALCITFKKRRKKDRVAIPAILVRLVSQWLLREDAGVPSAALVSVPIHRRECRGHAKPPGGQSGKLIAGRALSTAWRWDLCYKRGLPACEWPERKIGRASRREETRFSFDGIEVDAQVMALCLM